MMNIETFYNPFKTAAFVLIITMYVCMIVNNNSVTGKFHFLEES